MKKSIFTVTIIGSAIFLNACSTGENIQSKMGRYAPRTGDKNIVPDIKAFAINFPTSKSRGPASENKNTAENEINVTNKKLYFLSMIDQYETLKKYSSNFDAPKISICPNFHTGLISHYEKFNQDYNKNVIHKFSYSADEIKNDSYVAKHPELYLPLTKESTTPRIVDVIKSKTNLKDNDINELVSKAINIHLSKTYYELSELCEYGSSDNYYIYENLITHVKSGQFSPSTDNLNILLKSTVFANMAIINSLEKQTPKMGRSIASKNETGNLYSKDLLNKLNANWAKDYFSTLKN